MHAKRIDFAVTLGHLISKCDVDGEAVRQPLYAPRLHPTIPTGYADQTFFEPPHTNRHLSVGVLFDTIHARFYAPHGDAEAVVGQFRGNIAELPDRDAGSKGSGGDQVLMLGLLPPLLGQMLDVSAAVEQAAAELRASAQEHRQIREPLNQLRPAQVEARRALGQVELHHPPQHFRKRPLGGGD